MDFTENTLISEIEERYPELGPAFESLGMGFNTLAMLGCVTLYDACSSACVDVDMFIASLQDYLTAL